MPERPPNFRAGQVLKARPLQGLSATIRSGELRVLAPLQISRGSNQTTLSWVDQSPQKMDAVLTSTIAGDLSYNWKRIKRTTSHTWVDYSPLTTGKAWEQNDTNTLPIGFRVEMFKDKDTGDWVFQMDKC